MRAGPFMLAVGLTACGFEHGQLGGGDGGGSGSGDAAIDASGPAWWHAGWNYRMPITIVNASTATLPIGYQIGISHDFYAAPCTGQRNDVRFIYGAVTELNRAFDDTMPPWAWFQLASPLGAGETSTGEYFMYCGNTAPPGSPANPATLFEFYDAFEAAQINTTTWTVERGATISGGRLVLGGGTMNENGVISKTASFGPGYAIDFVAIPSQTTISSYGFWGGFDSTSSGPPYAIWWTFDATAIGPAYHMPTGVPYQGTPVNLTTAAHYFSVEHYGKSAMFRYDNVPYDTLTYDAAHADPMFVRLENYPPTPTVAFELVRVRQAVNPPPTVTVGAPQMKF